MMTTAAARARSAVYADDMARLRRQISAEMERRGIGTERLAEMTHMERYTLKARLNGDIEFRLSELFEVAQALHMIIVIGAWNTEGEGL